MKMLYSSLHRYTTFGINHMKNYCIFSHLDLCFLRFRGTKFWFLPTRSLHYKERKKILLNILANEQIAEYLKQDTIPWQDVKAAIVKLPDIGVDESDVNSCVLKSCLYLKLLDVGVSLYKDTISKGKSLSEAELSILLKLFAKETNKIPEYEDIVRTLFDIYKPHIENIPFLQFFCCIVFSNIKDLWEEMVKISEKSVFSGEPYLVKKAFDYDAPDVGWKIIHQHPSNFSFIVVQSYLDYCIRLAEANKFSVSLIDDLVNYCQKYVVLIPYVEILTKLNSLVSVLNKTQNGKYKWSVNKSHVSLEGYCSCCNLKLREVTISQEEYEELKSHVLRDTLIRNVDFKSSLEELRKFKLFLAQTSPYNFVIDGLNLIYGSFRVTSIQTFLEGLKSSNIKPLFIGRKHILNDKNFKYIQRLCQVFLTDNSSDDDIFVIYAALHGGLGTYFLSKDFYRPYHLFLEKDDLKRTFIKWKLTHLCSQVTTSGKLKVFRAFHSFLPQNANLAQGFCWHLPHASNCTYKNYLDKDFGWVCLRAVPL